MDSGLWEGLVYHVKKFAPPSARGSEGVSMCKSQLKDSLILGIFVVPPLYFFVFVSRIAYFLNKYIFI